MINGRVENLHLLAPISFLVEGRQLKVEFVIDTGFTGYLTLPEQVVANMQLPYAEDIRARLADDTEALLPIHTGIIVWDGSTFEIPVIAAGSRPLLGTALIAGYEIAAQLVEGGKVIIRPM
jgi:clan AA aspartic protease